MSLLICIETATEICSVALVQNGKVISLKENHEGNKHAAILTTLIQACLDECNVTKNQLSAIAVSMGPGSYTGLRVGVSTAKGLCLGLGIPLIAINTLTSLCYSVMETNAIDGLLIPMLDARRMEVYCGVYDKEVNEMVPTHAKIIDHESFLENLIKNKCYFFGNGAQKCKPLITHDNAVFIDGITCSAKGMAILAQQKFEQNAFESMAYFEPFYLKDFVGTKPKSLR